MRRVVISGGPGAGKTTLLLELGRLGYPSRSDSAREVIAERLARGQTPRPAPSRFAQEILRRDLAKYADAPPGVDLVFFDRSAVEALGMLNEASGLPVEKVQIGNEGCRYHETVFVLPPWPDIYRTDAERDHSFEHAERVYRAVKRLYLHCGYLIDEVPCLPVRQRAAHVLAALGAGHIQLFHQWESP